MAKAQEDRIARSLKRLGFQLGKGRGSAFKITAAGGSTAPNSTDTMTLDQIEIGDHIKPKRKGDTPRASTKLRMRDKVTLGNARTQTQGLSE